MKAEIQHVDDFTIKGTGEAKVWEKAEWLDLSILGTPTVNYRTQAKCLWSDKGIYLLFDCEDKKITCTFTKDFEELYMEDVVEAFFWPYEQEHVYFEYEISPLGYELPLICVNNQGKFHGWLPFKYTDGRKIMAKTSVTGGKKKPGAAITGWKAEVFIPYLLLIGMRNCPPAPGSTWRVNLCRFDFDKKPKTQWSLSTDNMENNFHNIDNFSTFTFVK